MARSFGCGWPMRRLLLTSDPPFYAPFGVPVRHPRYIFLGHLALLKPCARPEPDAPAREVVSLAGASGSGVSSASPPDFNRSALVRLVPLAQLVVQPGPCEGPVAVRGPAGDAEGGGGLFQ